MFSKDSARQADACRFCWMCRHICPVGGSCGNEAWTPRARGLMISMIERGTEFDKDIASAMYHCTLCDACANDCAAEAVPAGSEKLYFHPYLLGEMTPYYDDKLRASFVGVGMHHTKGHFTRAVMEGISYSMRDCLEEIKAQKIAVNEYRIIGGGAKGKLWRQILADVLATPLTSTVDNDSSLGSAMLAGVATGVFADFNDSVNKCVTVADVVNPIPENVEVYEKGFKDYRTIQKALAEVYHDII